MVASSSQGKLRDGIGWFLRSAMGTISDMADLKEILRLIGVVVTVIGAVTGIAIYVINQLIEKFLASKLEAYKHSLKLSFMEHEVRFKRLDEKRAEIVAHLFGLLATVKNTAYAYLTEDTRFPK